MENTTDTSCLIDTQTGLIALASAGGLIVCLLVSTLVLACQGCYLQRQVSALCHSHSNVDLVSGTGYWSTNQPEMEGLVGPCDPGVMLEEVKADREVAERETVEIQEKDKYDLARPKDDVQSKAFGPEEMALQVYSSSSRDSCPDIPQDLEDMPLMCASEPAVDCIKWRLLLSGTQFSVKSGHRHKPESSCKGLQPMERALTVNNTYAPLACLGLLLAFGLLGNWVLSICPSVCYCTWGHRVVDCSSRGLTQLPPGLQHNIRSLNLSFNSLQDVASQLSHYGHLRTLDLSYNQLERLPPTLPRSLWDIRASGNHLRSLDKNDTAYHWNLRVLDLSANELERVVFINNTLPSLHALNLSHNRFWTVPTNMPHNLEIIDLSHNYLVQILPGSLDRMSRLARFYLHANRFFWLPEGIFDRLSGLEVMTLGDNPWACEDEENITRLLRWAQHTRANILGCPCYIRPTCGQANLATPDTRDIRHDGLPVAWTTEVTSDYQAKSALIETEIYGKERGVNESGDQMLLIRTSSTTFYRLATHIGTTLFGACTPCSSVTPTKTHTGKTRIKDYRKNSLYFTAPRLSSTWSE
ncbi:uncharacterized protein LOC130115804 [Lampris incognitus]|uniref:uncharacterized protein LOC130115804 n=1 Tax=Lampris incognitus TaxID=2546036 RepID=UPI0024B4D68A|nr:uncharacterized protein LOC130115804 [Lampris incognitus]